MKLTRVIAEKEKKMFIYIVVKIGDGREFLDVVKILENRMDAMEYCKKMNDATHWCRYVFVKKKGSLEFIKGDER